MKLLDLFDVIPGFEYITIKLDDDNAISGKASTLYNNLKESFLQRTVRMIYCETTLTIEVRGE